MSELETIDDQEPTAVIDISDLESFENGVPYWVANIAWNPLVIMREGDFLKIYCHSLPMSSSTFTLANRKGQLVIGGPTK